MTERIAKENTAQRNRRWWREASEEVSQPYASVCGLCGGPVMCYPYDEPSQWDNGSMRRVIVICPCCSKPGCTHNSLAAVRGS